METRI
ncbi:hypothetical protein H4Q32_024707 [Labeo rohita]